MMDEEATSKKGKSLKGEKNHKKKLLLNSDDDSVFCWELLAYFFLYLMILFSIFFYYLSKFSKLFPSDQSISIQGVIQLCIGEGPLFLRNGEI